MNNYAFFSEIVQIEVSGFICNTIGDFLYAIKKAEKLDRNYISKRAQKMFSLGSIGKRYDQLFQSIDTNINNYKNTNDSFNIFVKEPSLKYCQ